MKQKAKRKAGMPKIKRISEETKTVIFLLLLLVFGGIILLRVASIPLEKPGSFSLTINPPVENGAVTEYLPARSAAVTDVVQTSDDPEQFKHEAAQIISEPSESPEPKPVAKLLPPDFTDYGVSLLAAEIEDASAEFTTSEPIEPLDEICGFYRPDVPMSKEHQTALFTICEEIGVDINLALGLIQLESTFDPYAVSETGCYGYCQLSRYFPSGLSPEDNMRAGIGWLGELIEQYGDVEKALTVYHLGSDDGTRTYAGAVLGYARAWGYDS